ncbi:hypothetical protein MJM95_28795, partial [Salmonella enterica subsp. enterica serovar Anatum]|nr:hypothetical protein [Salmonella enterica subsp. enterica serovar Anatum]
KIMNTNGAGDGALAALLHDITANSYHRSNVPNSSKHKFTWLTCGEKESSRCDMLLPGYARIEWYPLMRSGYRKPSGGVVSITRS